jgi:predicted transposase YdaD
MHTDSLFYRLFQERPATAFELAGLAVPPDPAYRMHAEEVKQTAFRLDGVLLPESDRPDLPVVFTEAQFFADHWFYARWLASIFLFLYRQRITAPWHAVAVFPDRAADTGETRPYEVLLHGGVMHRVYLTDLVGRSDLGPGARLARLVVLDQPALAVEARTLLDEAPSPLHRVSLIDLIETILVYKLPKLSRMEIQAMLHLPVTDLKQTRFYQEVFQEGEETGARRGELTLILRLLQRRFGPPGVVRQQRIEGLSTADLAALGDALLDFGSVADLDQWLDGHGIGG